MNLASLALGFQSRALFLEFLESFGLSAFILLLFLPGFFFKALSLELELLFCNQ